MSFGTYGEATCASPDCHERFVKKTPWQEHCSTECRNRHSYVKSTLPKRRREAHLAGRRR